jgi:hypothetical protein
MLWLTMVLGAGITIRKVGTYITDNDVISRVESFLYGNKTKQP